MVLTVELQIGIVKGGKSVYVLTIWPAYVWNKTLEHWTGNVCN